MRGAWDIYAAFYYMALGINDLRPTNTKIILIGTTIASAGIGFSRS
jgi:hypothetical protein